MVMMDMPLDLYAVMFVGAIVALLAVVIIGSHRLRGDDQE
jgi:hypothetical protein